MSFQHFGVISGCQMVVALCFLSLWCANVPGANHRNQQRLVHNKQVMADFVFWWWCFCMNLVGSSQRFIVFEGQAFKMHQFHYGGPWLSSPQCGRCVIGALVW